MSDLAVRPNRCTDNIIKFEVDRCAAYIKKLPRVSEVAVIGFGSLKQALPDRLEHFSAYCCIAANHGNAILRYAPLALERTLAEIIQ